MSKDLKYCSSCGQQIDAKANFCPKCGAHLTSYQASTIYERKVEGFSAVLSFFVPGLGQIYNGQIGRGIVILCIFALCLVSMFILIGFLLAPVLWIWNIYDAYGSAKKINQIAF